jgi:hypothetical protein
MNQPLAECLSAANIGEKSSYPAGPSIKMISCMLDTLRFLKASPKRTWGVSSSNRNVMLLVWQT